MRTALRTAALLVAAVGLAARAAAEPLSFGLTFDASITDSYTGRVYVMVSTSEKEPRLGPRWQDPGSIFALDVTGWKSGEPLRIGPEALSFPAPLQALPAGEYFVQAVMRRNLDSPYVGRGEGTAYSQPLRQALDGERGGTVALRIDQVLGPRPDPQTDRFQVVRLRSDLLSEFYDRDVVMEAAVILPEGYDPEAPARYPALYIIPGFGGNHLQALGFAGRAGRDSGGRIVKIGLNPQCRTGHHVFADSQNNGPRGRALVEEFIPHLEKQFRLEAAPWGRFLTGGSSGGWSSLWLQVTYPDFFGGVWSIAPDPCDFRAFQLTNLYEPGANLYVDREGGRIPIARRGGQPMLWYDDFAHMESVCGEGGQLSSFEAVFSARGPDGAPRPLFDRTTGAVDPQVAESWKPYDIRLVLEQNWASLGPRLAGKVRVFMGTDDNFYLDGAVHLLKESLERLESDAVVEIVPGRDHGSIADAALLQRIDREVLETFDAHAAQPAR